MKVSEMISPSFLTTVLWTQFSLFPEVLGTSSNPILDTNWKKNYNIRKF